MVFVFSGIFATNINAIDNTYSSTNSTYFAENENNDSSEYTTVYLDTPNTVEAVEAYHYLEDLPEDYITFLNDYTDDMYSNATRLATATRMYNCHSYAWYNQDEAANQYWINDPSPYYLDYSYCNVLEPQAGDIVCYFDDNGTTDTSDDINLHSGVVTSVLNGTSNNECGNSDLIMVISKWGPAGLYLHNGYECPYTKYSDSEYEGEIADYVKYYRDYHDYSYSINGSKHSVVCLECGYVSAEESHDYDYLPYNNEKHKGVCECGLESLTPHIVESISGSGIRGICMLCGETVVIGGGTIMPLGNNDGTMDTLTIDTEIEFITENGSYVLPNGVIVLSDYEQYLSGDIVLSDQIHINHCAD